MTRLEEQSVPAYPAATARRPAGDARPVGRGVVEVRAQPQGRITPERRPRGTAVFVVANAAVPDAASAPREAVLDRQPPAPVGACGVHNRKERFPLPPLPLLVRLEFGVVLQHRAGVEASPVPFASLSARSLSASASANLAVFGRGEGAIVVVPLAVIAGVVVGVIVSIVVPIAIVGGGKGAIFVIPLAVIVGIVVGVVGSVVVNVAIIGSGEGAIGVVPLVVIVASLSLSSALLSASSSFAVAKGRSLLSR